MTDNQVLLINSNLMKPPVAPIGLDYIGSIIIRNGFNVELLDLNFSENIEYDIRKKLINNSFLAIGLNIRNTDDCYYLSQDFFLPKIREIGKDIAEYTNSLVSGDKRFFIGATDKSDKNYNYNENLRLQEAIKKGYRGAFWDILQQINF